jgi:hypothetical protein
MYLSSRDTEFFWPDSNLNNMEKFPRLLLVLGVLAAFPALNAQQQDDHHGAEGGDPNAAVEKFGAVHMPISCAASVQAPFERGIALLHSFWYEEAVKQFQAVAVADPQCAMAQWGLAMTEWRPFGMECRMSVAKRASSRSIKPRR